jgi:3-deoxy-manno-octulosonate cytidylyltransferase (CMP-KDO synthetase)
MRPLVMIPARMASTRLPDKPLADIGGKPMIVHVAERAREADCGPVAVATDSNRVFEAVSDAGFTAVMTRDDHMSGSDRIHEAIASVDPSERHDVVINVQGDLPTIEPRSIQASLAPLSDPVCDIGTLGVEIVVEEEKTNPNVVKIVATPLSDTLLKALYFTRATAPSGEGPLYHHIGLYAYRRAALDRFVALPPGVLERRERLEQLRALENGMTIHAAIIDSVPLGVDTQPDLERARALLAK